MVQLGFVFVRQAAAPRFEAFYNQIVTGLQDGLGPTGGTLLVAGVESRSRELAMYEHWRRTEVVDAVIVKDLLDHDDRPDRLRSMLMPFVALTDTGHAEGLSAVTIDNSAAVRDCFSFLVSRGHRRIARVTGPLDLVHTGVRTRAFEAEARAAGVSHIVAAGDYTEESGALATSALLDLTDRPTAIVYDNDLMAVGGLSVARAIGVDVPGAVSLLAWDDSVTCQLTAPPLSALSHDVQEIGVQLAELALGMLEHGSAATSLASQPAIVERGTTALALVKEARGLTPA